MMRRGLRELLDRACGPSHVREVAYDGDGRDASLWQELAGAGWTGVAAPESAGGAGGRFEEAMLVFEEAGRAALPLPLPTTLLASRAIAAAPQTPYFSDLLSRIARGDASVAIALRDADRDPPGDATPEGDGWTFNARNSFVPYGPLADYALIEAGSGLIVLPADAPALRWTDLKTMDRTAPLFALEITDARVERDVSLYGNTDARDAIERLTDEWRAALAAETLGAAQRLLEMTVAYAKERVQFGRPIGTNQAVKWRIADMGAAVERMRAAVYHAAVKIDADAPDRAVAVSMAKAATAAPGAFVGSQAIHVHGGIGFTWEHDAHLYFKRIKSNELLLGDGTYHTHRIADEVLAS
jgi:alkylation response protein AidB-like acyl-CoA dehydrogenase